MTFEGRCTQIKSAFEIQLIKKLLTVALRKSKILLPKSVTTIMNLFFKGSIVNEFMLRQDWHCGGTKHGTATSENH